MNIDLSVMSDIRRKELFASVLAERNQTRMPDLLQDIITKSIFKNITFFKNQEENPFVNLPNTVVQKFFKMIKEKRNWNKTYVLPTSEELGLAKMLLNPNVTEFDGYAFNKKCSEFNHKDCYMHIVENCPKMTKGVHVHCQCWARENSEQYLDKLTLNCLQKWTKLRHFYVRGIFCNDKIMRLIQENCPQLEGLEFTFSSEFTDAGVEILTKMMQLKYVHIKVHDTEIYKNEEHIDSYLKLLWLLNLIAGRVPNLTIADFGIKKEASMLFIGAHGHYFPDKNLTIRQVELTDITSLWPPCISVEKLILHGTFSSALLENITLPSSVRELHIDGAINSVVYAALLKLGPELTKLQFNQGNSQQVDITPIDMYKVLAACPKLKSFHFMSGNRPVLKRNSSESALLPSDYFQEFERFSFTRQQDVSNDTHEVEPLRLFSMFLLGSSKKRKLNIASESHQLDVVLDVLKNDPTCFEKLEEIEVDFYDLNMLAKILEMAKQLIWHSPCMEKILFRFIYNLHYIQVVDHICKHHGWFLELVNSIGLRCCGNTSRISSATDSSEIDIMDLEEMVSKSQEIEAMIRDLNTRMYKKDLLFVRSIAEALGSSDSSSDED